MGRAAGAVRPGAGRPDGEAAQGNLLQQCDLVLLDQDFRVLGGVTAGQKKWPTEHPDHGQVDERMRTNAEPVVPLKFGYGPDLAR